MDRRSRYFSLRPMTSLTTPRHCSLLCHPHTPATDPQEERDVSAGNCCCPQATPSARLPYPQPPPMSNEREEASLAGTGGRSLRWAPCLPPSLGGPQSPQPVHTRPGPCRGLCSVQQRPRVGSGQAALSGKGASSLRKHGAGGSV